MRRSTVLRQPDPTEPWVHVDADLRHAVCEHNSSTVIWPSLFVDRINENGLNDRPCRSEEVPGPQARLLVSASHGLGTTPRVGAAPSDALSGTRVAAMLVVRFQTD